MRGTRTRSTLGGRRGSAEVGRERADEHPEPGSDRVALRGAGEHALAALVQCAVLLSATGAYVDEGVAAAPEVLEENRFIAVRDGMRAQFLDAEHDTKRPARDVLDELLAACEPHAAALGCEAELAAVAALALEPGDHRQRMLAGVRQGDAVGPGLGMLVSALASDFTADAPPAAPRARAGSAHIP